MQGLDHQPYGLLVLPFVWERPRGGGWGIVASIPKSATPNPKPEALKPACISSSQSTVLSHATNEGIARLPFKPLNPKP